MNRKKLSASFQKHFGSAPSRTYFSPGRVNLIGEHTDYNGGYVMPVAIDLGTYFAVRPNGTNIINVLSESFDGAAALSLDDEGAYRREGVWHDYVKGALVEMKKIGTSGDGLDIHVAGDLPTSSGLSSSASFTVGMLFLLDDLWNTGIGRLAIVQMAKNVENLFIGLQCGVMDQFVVAMGQAERCVCLHCHSLHYQLVPLQLADHEIVITDSRVPRKLSESAYNERREECEAALGALRQDRDLEFLCSATSNDVEACDALRSMATPYKRARHVVSENERVIESAAALADGNLARLGQLMYASHVSLRDDFQVSCPELDTLVETAMSVPGVLGSRMTGAGFGGCMVSLVASSAVPNFVATIGEKYSMVTPYRADVIRCHTGDGVKRLS
ncbi:MAG: galactokinase [Gammaproteobacteria bacterium]|nr:galactokinase [Gammaproteobacteria bacterium]